MKNKLREDLEELLSRTEGLVMRAEEAMSPEQAKHWIRRAHEDQRQSKLEEARSFIEQNEEDLLQYFADGPDVDPTRIDPVVSPVITELDNRLWRYASLTWSVPVSQGYGRRTKFLVRDRFNGKLIAIFALGDPVIGLQVRDQEIGWTKEQRHSRLYNVYDAFVLGALDPYRQLLAGKLVALLAISNETRQFLRNKYFGTKTVISGQAKDPTPVLVTTSSALGKSSVYNRLTYDGQRAYRSVGFTSGFGHFHISEEMFEQLVLFTQVEGKEEGAAFGKGANYRFRVIRTALKELGLSGEGLRHGIKREVFLAPLAHNWREYLRGETDSISPINLPADEISQYYLHRWAIDRAIRKPEYKTWDRETMRLSNYISNAHIQYSLSAAFAQAELVNIDQAQTVKIDSIEIKQANSSKLDEQESGNRSTTEIKVGKNTFSVSVARHNDGSIRVNANKLDGPKSPLLPLVNKHELKIVPSPIHEDLVYVPLKVSVPAEDGRISLNSLSRRALEELFGENLDTIFPRAKGIILGTRRELFRDETSKKNELCVVFSPTDTRIPYQMWTWLRPIALERGLGRLKRDTHKNVRKSPRPAKKLPAKSAVQKTPSTAKAVVGKKNQVTKKTPKKETGSRDN